jgi:SAM-dependent methyltransferase
MTEDHFAGEAAEQYDDDLAEMFEPTIVDPAVDFLADLAGDGRALEFGVGTGRIALPLSRRGVPVHGIDLSADMLAQLRAKLRVDSGAGPGTEPGTGPGTEPGTGPGTEPGAQPAAGPGAGGITLTQGDFATTTVDGTFRLAYLVFNTVMNLTTQDALVACVRNAAAHLEPGGCFVVEVMVPDLQRLPHGETIRPFQVGPTKLGFDEYDVATQALTSHHSWKDGTGWHNQSVPFRYVWPAELDLMAQLADLALRERWGGWRREPFTSDSRKHISVWEKPA